MTKDPTSSGVTAVPTSHPSNGTIEASDYYLLPGDHAGTVPDLVWRRTTNHWYFVCFADE